MSTKQALELWKSQLPSYNRIIAKCVRQVTKPLSRFNPPQFQTRIEEFKEYLQKYDGKDKTQIIQQYMDVISNHIEGKKNKSIIELANELKREYGGDVKYWLNTIQTIGDNVDYADEVKVWEVKKPFNERLYMDAEDLSNFRQFTKIAKKYLGCVKNLIKSINKFDANKDAISKIDELYSKLKKVEEKYITFGEQANIFQKSTTIQDLSNNISQMNKVNAKKTLFRYMKPEEKKKIPLQNTLLHYNFKIDKPKSERLSGPKSNIFITHKMMKGEQLQVFEENLKLIKSNYTDFNELRKDFQQSKVAYNKDKEAETNFTSIWDKDYHFSYVSYPIENNEQFSFVNPYDKHDFINYQIDSEEQYQELLGEDLDKQNEFSEASSLTDYSRFLVSEGHCSDDEDGDKNQEVLKFNVDNFFGEPWSFSRNQESKLKKYRKQNYQMVNLMNPVKITKVVPQADSTYRIVTRKAAKKGLSQ